MWMLGQRPRTAARVLVRLVCPHVAALFQVGFPPPWFIGENGP